MTGRNKKTQLNGFRVLRLFLCVPASGPINKHSEGGQLRNVVAASHSVKGPALAGMGSGCWGLFSFDLGRFQRDRAGDRAFNCAVLAYMGFLCGPVAAVAAGVYMGKGTAWAASTVLPGLLLMQHEKGLCVTCP